MAMLSELLKYGVVEDGVLKGRITDLAVELIGQDYPVVTAIYFRSDGAAEKRVAWSDVAAFDKPGEKFDIRTGAEHRPADEHPDSEVLLRRDILDALIIDLLSRRTTRSADLLMSHADGEMRLHAADVGLGAMLRRITRGLYSGADRDSMFDWKYVEFLRGDPQAVDSGAGYNMRIGRLPAGEIAQIADYIPYLHAAELLTLLPDAKAARVLEAMSIERQLQVIEEFHEQQAVDLLTIMSPDRAADLVGRLHVATMKKYLGMMEKIRRERIIELLRYPEDSVGGVMINNVMALGEATTVKSARDQVRAHSKRGDFISMIFATETNERKVLRGALTLRELLDADDEARLRDIMDPYVVTLNAYDPATSAAYRVIGGQLAAMPVTDAEGDLIGAMTIESAISQVLPAGSGLSGIKVFA